MSCVLYTSIRRRRQSCKKATMTAAHCSGWQADFETASCSSRMPITTAADMNMKWPTRQPT